MLTHQPGTNTDAAKMSETVREITRSLDRAMLLAQHKITQEQIEENEMAEDGVMRYIE